MNLGIFEIVTAKLTDKGLAPIIAWLLEGDVSIQYQTHRDLLGSDPKTLNSLQKRIATEGWGKRFLDARNSNGHWGVDYYLPKWKSTHYTLLDLKNIGLPRNIKETRESTQIAFDLPEGATGGINFAVTIPMSDVCVNGMILNFGTYFNPENQRIPKIIDYILSAELLDGGWNCESYKHATHSSLHSTISILEGLSEYLKNGTGYRTKEIETAVNKGIEFLLVHRLYKSHRTGEVIDPKMTMFSYPSRWKYDILRALDYLQSIRYPYDERMGDALEILIKKQRADGTWPLQHKHAGQVHFDMEKPGKPSRWNTLRALRVLKMYSA